MSMTLEDAIEIVARAALESKSQEIIEAGWGDFPDIGMSDWQRICDTIAEKVGPSVGIPELSEAYNILEARAAGQQN